MFSIFKRSSPQSGPPDLSLLGTDMHSHLVPGVDDGSSDLETSLELMAGLVDLGYKNFIATPHVLWDMFRNTRETIAAPFQALQEAAATRLPGVGLSHAAEYYLDDYVDEQLREQRPLMTLRGNLVLAEFSFVSLPLDYKEKLFALQMAGYQPVIAHPERYTYLAQHLQVYRELKDAGYFLQVNLLSLTGYYGRAAMELGMHLVSEKLVDFLGTDLHHERHLQALRRSSQLTAIIKSLQDAGVLRHDMLSPP